MRNKKLFRFDSYYLILFDIPKTILKCMFATFYEKYTMWFKSYEHFHYLTMNSQTDAQQSLVIVLHTSA